MKIGMIGKGTIARFVAQNLKARGHSVEAYLLRPLRVAEQSVRGDGPIYVAQVADLPKDLDQVIDCAGHDALHEYGAEILSAGFDMTTVSLGALADEALSATLRDAATASGAKLYLASGAIGALDALRSARIGELQSVRYFGRKPPKGWAGSAAEDAIDLNALGSDAMTHFKGTARQAALRYPKNANVAAAVALAGIGFDRTEAELIADPTISENIHEITAEGSFGRFEFRITGNALSGNPRSSALAAMSVVDVIEQCVNPIRF